MRCGVVAVEEEEEKMNEMMERREDVAREGRTTRNGERGHTKIFMCSRARERRMSLYEENGLDRSGKEEEKEPVGKRKVEKEATARWQKEKTVQKVSSINVHKEACVRE